MTRSIVTMDISPEAHAEIRGRLDAAGYDHAIEGDRLDMHGIALEPGAASSLASDDEALALIGRSPDRICATCDGEGSVWREGSAGAADDYDKCDNCEGTGSGSLAHAEALMALARELLGRAQKAERALADVTAAKQADNLGIAAKSDPRAAIAEYFAAGRAAAESRHGADLSSDADAAWIERADRRLSAARRALEVIADRGVP